MIPADRLVFDVYDNPRGSISCEGNVYYESYFASGKRSIPKIKFDLTADEVLVLPPSRQEVFHTYSDFPQDKITINSYSYPEAFAEKVRALGERGRPRDLKAVINLYRNDQLPSYGQLGLKALNGNSLEIIRFAAGNRLCVELDYTDLKGHRSSRVIEPYSLRQALNAVSCSMQFVEDGGIRAYKTDQINDASVTNRVFVPRYQIELSPTGHIAEVSRSTGAFIRAII